MTWLTTILLAIAALPAGAMVGAILGMVALKLIDNGMALRARRNGGRS